MTNQERFGSKIKELRKAKNLSQRDLAQAVEKRLQAENKGKSFDFTYLSKIESAGLIPSMPVIKALVSELQVGDEVDLYSLAGKVNQAIETAIKADSAKQFFRSALRHDLSEDDWKKLLDDLEKRKKGK